VSNPALRELADEMERDEVLRWSNSLPAARVHRWGGMISTPDETLQVLQYLIVFSYSVVIHSVFVNRNSCFLTYMM